MNRIGSALIEFHPERNKLGEEKELRHGLSVVVPVGNTLWVANDETLSLERFTWQQGSLAGEYIGNEHTQFSLADYLALPMPPLAGSTEFDEADIEGLDYRDGYLWLVTSHSLKRSQPKNKTVEKDFERLAKISSDGNRYLLARIPLVEREGKYVLAQEAEVNGKKVLAGQLRTSTSGNLLTEILTHDQHLHPFLAIPGKDNGFDIEGLAIGDNDRVFLGLRGPVLRGWAIILELQVATDAAFPSELTLLRINPNNRSSTTGNPYYRKHFLDLGGLGIRDLCRDGDDLLILAGPTMDLDGPVTVFRWIGGALSGQERLVSGDSLQKVIDLPHGHGGDHGFDHAEGLAILPMAVAGARAVIVVYDSAASWRLVGDNAVVADIFAL